MNIRPAKDERYLMAQLQGSERSRYVQDMFGRIAGRYNLLNRVMTGGQDVRWRRFVVQQAALPNNSRLLDLATGTGDIAFEVHKQHADAQIVGADFSLPMMHVGQQQPLGNSVQWAAADALQLPFPNAYFDAVVSGYLLRNVIDIDQTLKEQLRVLKPGGRMVTLDTSPPPDGLMKPFIRLHMHVVIPVLGRLIGGSDAVDAYKYLPESTQAFKTPDELAALMRQAGFINVAYKTFLFGVTAVHWGEKPA